MSTYNQDSPSMNRPTDSELPRAPEVLVQIRGGVLQEIVSDSPVFVTIVDWDNTDIETVFKDNGRDNYDEVIAEVKHEMFVGKEDAE